MEEHLNVTPPMNLNEDRNTEAPNTLLPSDLTHLLQGGIAASKLGEKELARKLLLKVTSLEPDNETAWLWLASLSEHAQERLDYLKKVLAINPANERALSWVKLTKEHIAKTFVQRGADAIKVGDKNTAIQFLLQAVDFAPENEMAWIHLSSIADSLEDKLAYLQRILNSNPANDQVREMFDTTKELLARDMARKGIEAVKVGNLKLASNILQDALDYDPEVEEVWLLQEYVFDALEEEEAAKRRLEASQNSLIPISEAPNAVTESAVLETSNIFSESPVTEIPSTVTESVALEAPNMASESLGLVSESAISEDTASNPASFEGFSPVPHTVATETTNTASNSLPETPSEVSNAATTKPADIKEKPEAHTSWTCPICQTEAKTAFDICPACQSMLTLDDIDMLLANEYVNEGLIRAGIQKIKRSFKFDIHAEDYYKLGLAYLNLKDLKESIAFFQASHRLDAENHFLEARIDYLIQRRDGGPVHPKLTFTPAPSISAQESQAFVSVTPAEVEYVAETNDSIFAEAPEWHEESDPEKCPTGPLTPIEGVDEHFAQMSDVSHEALVQDRSAQTAPTVLIEKADVPDLSQYQIAEENVGSDFLLVEENPTETGPGVSFEGDTSVYAVETFQSDTADLTEVAEQTESHGWPLPEFDGAATQPIVFANAQAPVMEATAVQAFSEEVSVVKAAQEDAVTSPPSLSDHQEDDVLEDFFFSDEEDEVETTEPKVKVEQV